MKLIKSILFSLLLISAQNVHAIIITLPGDTVNFVYDTASVDSLFGTLAVSGDSIFATPVDFNANSIEGVAQHSSSATAPSTDYVNALGTIQVVAKEGYAFAAINVGESGNYNMTGTGNVTMDASLRLVDWNNFTTGGPVENTTLSSASDFGLNDSLNHNWSASGGFDMTTTAWEGITHVGLSLTNILTATSGTGTGEYAFIQKGAVGGAVGIRVSTIPAVPVPAAFWLFASGLVGLVGLARRRARVESFQ